MHKPVVIFVYFRLVERVDLLINPMVRNHRHHAERIDRVLGGAYDVRQSVSAWPGHLIELAETASREGADAVVVLGGDGSINEVVNGLLAHRENTTRLLVFPTGTGNDLSRTLEVRADIDELSSILRRGRTRALDVGRAQFIDRDGVGATRYFVNITDVGMGGVTVQTLHNEERWLTPRLAYMKAILMTFLTYRKQRVRYVHGATDGTRDIVGLVVANGRYFGSGLGIAPAADLSDGRLEVVCLGDISMMDYLRNLGRLMRCRPVDHPEVDYEQCTSITIEGADVPIDMDGEFVGFCPLRIEAVPAALDVLVP